GQKARPLAGNAGDGARRWGEKLLVGGGTPPTGVCDPRVHFGLVPYCTEVSASEKCLRRGLYHLLGECQMETVAWSPPRCPHETGRAAGQSHGRRASLEADRTV